MIKRVVNRKKEVVTKYPEYDINKLFIVEFDKDNYERVTCRNNKFYLGCIGNDKVGLLSYNTFEELIKNITRHSNIFIIDGKDELIRFLTGCREFDTVKPIQEEVNAIADDKVSIDDVSDYKIYACMYATGKIQMLIKNHSDNMYEWTSFANTVSYSGVITPTLKEAILEVVNIADGIYQFDTQEEFLRWALEKVTGN